ncbi:hypothetical protein Acr_00g0078390 [Actinidia rufa]|uniref:Uncharacterized protein n=1 Tax=Actinidia rufa TaxID=165716 RepID=A0A7J0DTI1_9ERIC|nr:hypothetical protein Acr_00g0078390 [Actinidia rufa]
MSLLASRILLFQQCRILLSNLKFLIAVPSIPKVRSVPQVLLKHQHQRALMPLLESNLRRLMFIQKANYFVTNLRGFDVATGLIVSVRVRKVCFVDQAGKGTIPSCLPGSDLACFFLLSLRYCLASFTGQTAGTETKLLLQKSLTYHRNQERTELQMTELSSLRLWCYAGRKHTIDEQVGKVLSGITHFQMKLSNLSIRGSLAKLNFFHFGEAIYRWDLESDITNVELHGREFYGCADTFAAIDLMVSGPFPYRTDRCFIDEMNRCLYLYMLLVLAVGGEGPARDRGMQEHNPQVSPYLHFEHVDRLMKGMNSYKKESIVQSQGLKGSKACRNLMFSYKISPNAYSCYMIGEVEGSTSKGAILKESAGISDMAEYLSLP